MNTNITQHSKEAHQAIENIAAHVFIRKDEEEIVLQAIDRFEVLKDRISKELIIIRDNFEIYKKGDPESLNNRNAQDVMEATNSANVNEDEKTGQEKA